MVKNLTANKGDMDLIPGQEDSTCHGATKPVCPTTEPAPKNPCFTTREVTAMRRPHAENRHNSLLAAIRERLCIAMKTQYSQN